MSSNRGSVVLGALAVGLYLFIGAFRTMAAAPADSTAQGNDEIQEIVVTAQRRSEREIDVPMSVTTVSGDALAAANVTNTRDLAQVAPGLTFVQNADYSIITLRGIGSFQEGAGAENNVAIYMDGSYLPSKVSGIFDFPGDISDIEVLKGPQGTLWGRNATAGAILIQTLEPSFTASGTGTLGYGSLDDKYTKFYVTGPLIDGKLAGSMAGYYENSEGYLTNVVYPSETHAGGFQSWLLRGKLLFTPTDNSKFILTSMYSKRLDGTTTDISFPVGLSFGSAGFSINPNAITTTAPHKYASQIPGSDSFWNTQTVRESLEASVDTSLGKFSSVSAINDMKSDAFLDSSFTSAQGVYDHLEEPERVYTEDINFASNRFGPFQLLSGISYIHDRSEFGPVAVFVGPWNQTVPPALDIDYRVFSESVAAYFEGDVSITDRLSFTAGARYTHEHLEYSGSDSFTAFPRIAANSWNQATPHVSVKYKLTDDTNAYFSYSRGFKSGSYDYSSFATTPVNPETVDGFEVGVKSNVNRNLSFAVAGFYQLYKNIQVETLSTNPAVPLVFFPALQNAASAKSYGVDLDTTYRPVNDLTFGLKIEALSAKYTNFADAEVFSQTPLDSCPPASLPAGCGGAQVRKNVSGTDLVDAAHFTGTLSVDYVMHPSIGNVDLNANLYETSKFYWEVGDVNEQPGYGVLNARITWTPHNGPFSFSLWGKNLTNADYTQGRNEFNTGVLWAPPLTMGGEITGKF